MCSFRAAIAIWLASVAALLVTVPLVYADVADLTIQTGCSQIPSYTGVLDLSSQKYDAYVRLAKRGEVGVVYGYAQARGDYGNCVNLGEVKASGDRWTKLGSFDATNDDFVLQLAGASLANMPDANRPSIMLVPHDNPPCVPDAECYVDVDGLSGYVRPTGTLLNQDSLNLVEVKRPDQDKIKQVRYYVDNYLVDISDNLQPFDERYFSVEGQKLSRVIEYTSNQWVIIDSEVPQGFVGNFSGFLYRLIQRNPELFKYAIYFVSLIVIWVILTAIIQIFVRRRNWRVSHGFMKKHEPNAIMSLLYSIESSRFYRHGHLVMKSVIALVFIFSVFVIFNTYGLAMTSVDGMSMQRTYYTGDMVVVNKLPKTIANINGREYVPNRGEVVIVRSAFGNTALRVESTEAPLLIKRVIALPGERVVVNNGTLTVYNEKQPNGFRPDEDGSWAESMTSDSPTVNLDVTLGVSEVFVSGDNRPESIDSRFNGPLPLKEVVGSVGIRIWPLSR